MLSSESDSNEIDQGCISSFNIYIYIYILYIIYYRRSKRLTFNGKNIGNQLCRSFVPEPGQLAKIETPSYQEKENMSMLSEMIHLHKIM
jgi:hypothetical protein